MISFDDITLKPDWMKPPSWRWIASEYYLADPTKDPSQVEDDRFLRELIDFKRYLLKYPDKPSRYWKKFPELATAYQMYLNSMTDGWRWLLEAYLMTKLSDTDIARRLQVNIKPTVIRRYRSLFFDIDKYRESEAAVTANLLATSKVKLNATGISDYTWKVFAYVWGADAFEEMFYPRQGKRKKAYMEWMREANSQNLDVYAFHVTRDLKQNYNEYALDILKTARTYWDLGEDEDSSLEAQAKRDFITELSKHVHMTILNADPKDKQDLTEDFTGTENKVFIDAGNEKQKKIQEANSKDPGKQSKK